jgi:hypothetical protein
MNKAMMSVGGFNQAIQNAGGMLQRAMATQVNSGSKAVTLSIRPLIPMIIAGSALLYHQGNEVNKPGGGERAAWWKILLESALAYTVLANTSGVYPLFGIGLAAYRAGQKPNALEQVKAVVNTAITMLLGYIGVQFMGGMNKMAVEMEDRAIYSVVPNLKKSGASNKEQQLINRWLQHLRKQGNSFPVVEDRQLFTDLRQHVIDLSEKLRKLYSGKGAPKPGSDKFKALSEEALLLKTQAAEKLELLGKDAYKGLIDKTASQVDQAAAREAKHAARNLAANIHHSQSAWTRMVRGMNPLFGYIIMGLVVGAPLARWINSWIGQKRPDLQKKTFKQALFPQESRIMSPAPNATGYGAYNSGYGQPYMVWNGFNNDQPSTST